MSPRRRRRALVDALRTRYARSHQRGRRAAPRAEYRETAAGLIGPGELVCTERRGPKEQSAHCVVKRKDQRRDVSCVHACVMVYSLMTGLARSRTPPLSVSRNAVRCAHSTAALLTPGTAGRPVRQTVRSGGGRRATKRRRGTRHTGSVQRRRPFQHLLREALTAANTPRTIH